MIALNCNDAQTLDRNLKVGEATTSREYPATRSFGPLPRT
jgi:hypothetical protein